MSKEKPIKIPFSNMGDDGMFWLQGFGIEKINGQKILKNMYKTYSLLSEATAGYASLAGAASGIQSMASIDLGQTAEDIMALASSGKLFSFSKSYSADNLGLVHTVAASGAGTDAILFNSYSGVLTSILEHLLYASSNHLGRGYRGTATGGSTTTLIDTTVNFVTGAGMSTSAGSNKVYNVDNGEIYTITSITTTTNTNDTLNFAAGTACGADDIYICFKDDFQKFDTSIVRGNHFVSQATPTSWKRQIVLWEDYYYILNGNYIATLNIDGATFSATNKQLPYRCQAVCMDVNSSKMLVGAEFRDEGKLLLRDTFSSGWLNVIDLKRQPLCIKAYKSGWLVTMGDGIYYTNGYSLELITKVPFDYSGFNWSHYFNGMAIIDEKIYVVRSGEVPYPRGRSGVYVFDLNNGGWSYCNLAVDETGITNNDVFSEYTNVGCLFATPNISTPTIFIPHSMSYGTNADNIVKLGLNGGQRASVVSYTKLPRKMKLGTISLNLMSRIERIQQVTTSLTATVQVNYGQGKRRFGNSVVFGAASTKNIPVNTLGAYAPGKIGQELLVLDGDLAGVRTFIKGVTGGGSSSEALTVAPPFETDPLANTTAIKYDLYSAGSREVDIDNMPQELNFNIPDFYSDNLWIEIIIKTNETSDVFVDIHDINVW